MGAGTKCAVIRCLMEQNCVGGCCAILNSVRAPPAVSSGLCQ
jgi:hypothetical protein